MWKVLSTVGYVRSIWDGEASMKNDVKVNIDERMERFRERVTAYFSRVNSRRGLVNAYFNLRSLIISGIRMKEEQLKILDEVYQEFLRKFGGERG